MMELAGNLLLLIIMFTVGVVLLCGAAYLIFTTTINIAKEVKNFKTFWNKNGQR